ncbi:hypothetical protein ACFPRL_27765 [Pseudoclavibacter helvolus]
MLRFWGFPTSIRDFLARPAPHTRCGSDWRSVKPGGNVSLRQGLWRSW